MSARRFSFWQKVAALAPLLLVASYLPGEIMVRCHVDGLLRPAPCRAHEMAPGQSGPALEARDCCDREITATNRPVSEAVRATGDELMSVAALAPCTAPGIGAAAPPEHTAWAAQRYGPARGGPAIVLAKHAFLI